MWPPQVDVFAFGLVVLELTTLKRLDHWSSSRWPELLDSVTDPETKAFIAKCLGPEDQRPTVAELLEARLETTPPACSPCFALNCGLPTLPRRNAFIVSLQCPI